MLEIEVSNILYYVLQISFLIRSSSSLCRTCPGSAGRDGFSVIISLRVGVVFGFYARPKP